MQLSGTASSAAMPNDYTQPATVISSFETMTVQAANSSLMEEEEEIKEAESGDDFVHISVSLLKKNNLICFSMTIFSWNWFIPVFHKNFVKLNTILLLLF